MICTNCGKGELQEITGTALVFCPLCNCKLIAPPETKAEYEIVHNSSSRSITIPSGKEIWVNGILLPAGTYGYRPTKIINDDMVDFIKWLADNSPDNLYGEIDYIQTTARELLK